MSCCKAVGIINELQVSSAKTNKDKNTGCCMSDDEKVPQILPP